VTRSPSHLFPRWATRQPEPRRPARAIRAPAWRLTPPDRELPRPFALHARATWCRSHRFVAHLVPEEATTKQQRGKTKVHPGPQALDPQLHWRPRQDSRAAYGCDAQASSAGPRTWDARFRKLGLGPSRGSECVLGIPNLAKRGKPCPGRSFGKLRKKRRVASVITAIAPADQAPD
jgi:hypothetical protein